MKKSIICFICFICLFVCGVKGVSALALIPPSSGECTYNPNPLLQGQTGWSYCPIKIQIGNNNYDKHLYEITIDFDAEDALPLFGFNIENIANGWYAKKMDYSTYKFSTTLSSLPAGEFVLGTIVKMGYVPLDNAGCTTSFTIDSAASDTRTCTPYTPLWDNADPPTVYYGKNGELVANEWEMNISCYDTPCSTLTNPNDETEIHYYGASGSEVDNEFLYKISCPTKRTNCEVLTNPTNISDKRYVGSDGSFVGENTYLIQCGTTSEKQCKALPDDSNTVHYFGTNGTEVTEANYARQCHNDHCAVYPLSNGSYLYFDNNGEETNETDFGIKCPSAQDACKVKNDSSGVKHYFDREGHDVAEMAFVKSCKTGCIEYTDQSGTKHYLDMDKEEISAAKFAMVCSAKEPCSKLKDEANVIHYYDEDGNEVDELDYIGMCLKPKCETMKSESYSGNIFYFDDKTNLISENEYIVKCLHPACDSVESSTGLVHYFDKEGKEVTKEEQEGVCTEPLKCVKEDGKYYDSIGRIVSESEYRASCSKEGETENPKTGASIPLLVLLFMAIVGIISLLVAKKEKMFKI